MSTCYCGVTLDTPTTIYDDGNDYYDAGTDIISTIFDTSDTEFDHSESMQLALWRVYRHRIIGNCDTEEWVQVMADRLNMVGPKYDLFLAEAESLGTDLLDLSEAAYTRILQRTAIEDTDGDVRTVERSHTTEHESLPQTETDDTKYLDARQTDTDTDTDTYAPNNQDSETYKAYQGLNGDTFKRMMQSYPNILTSFADEFAAYFAVML